MPRWHRFVLVFSLAGASVRANVVAYECNSFPEDAGWEIVALFCNPDLWIENGWFFQHVEPGKCVPPPGGDLEALSRSLADFADEQRIFIEWRMQTNGDRSEIIGVAPAAFVAGGFTGISYHFTIARDQVRLIRDLRLPIIWVDIQPGVPHTYRLELYGDELYLWHIDGQVVDSGVPEGAYPTSDSTITWAGRSWFLESTIAWDYIRYGTIPVDGSGDYDSDGQVDGDDFYFFDECFLGSDVDAGPGCRFADFDADTDVDCDDWTAFTLAWTAPEDPPVFTPCAAPPPPVPTASTWGSALVTLILLTAGATAHCRTERNARDCRCT